MATIVPAGKRNEVITWTASLTTATSDATLIDVTDYDEIIIWFQLQNTVTPADLSPSYAQWVRPDGGTTANGPPQLRAYTGSVAVSDGTNINYMTSYDVHGMDKVRIIGSNNNAGTKTLMVTIYLSQRS